MRGQTPIRARSPTMQTTMPAWLLPPWRAGTPITAVATSGDRPVPSSTIVACRRVVDPVETLQGGRWYRQGVGADGRVGVVRLSCGDTLPHVERAAGQVRVAIGSPHVPRDGHRCIPVPVFVRRIRGL